MLKFRLDDPWGYVNNRVDNATGSHFNQPGHSLADLRVTIREQVKKKCVLYKKEREEYFIGKFNTLQEGKKQEGWRDRGSGGGFQLVFFLCN